MSFICPYRKGNYLFMYTHLSDLNVCRICAAAQCHASAILTGEHIQHHLSCEAIRQEPYHDSSHCFFE